MASNPYNPPPASSHHTVIVQPVVVTQPTVRSQTNDFLGGIGRALDNTANDLLKATVVVSRDVSNAITSNPLDFLKAGYVVQVISKLCGKSLRVLENGVVDCSGDSGTACQFEVVRTGPNRSAIKLKNVAQPQYFLAVIGGYFVGYGQGGPDCDFYPTVALDNHVVLESCMNPGCHVGVLPSGQITSPGQTSKQTDASHFKIKYINTEKEKEIFRACKDGNLETVKQLSLDCGIQYVRDHECYYAYSPVHLAARHGHLSVVKYLVTEGHCNPDIKDAGGDTPLHDACGRGHLDVVRYLVTEAHCYPDVKDADGNTPLHDACWFCHFDVVRCLVNEAHSDPNIKNNEGETPLHYACHWDHLDVVRCLVNEAQCNPNIQNRKEETPLHTACKNNNVAIVECLLSDGRADPNCSTKNGSTPLFLSENTDIIRLLLKHGAVASDLYKCMVVLPDGSPRRVAQSTISVFVLGDKGAGKSTLTKSLMIEKANIMCWMGRISKVSGVKMDTAGIECITIHSSRIGHLTIYDLAGHREFHNAHDTVLRSSISGQSPGMFLFVVDMRPPPYNLKRTVSYWLSFIENQVCCDLLTQVCKPYVLAVGSHAELISSSEMEEKQSILQSFFTHSERIHFVALIMVDCRFSESQSLTELRSHMLHTHYILQRSIPEVTFCAHCFHVYLVAECGSKPGMQLGHLMKIIECDPLTSKEKFLPQSLDALHQACRNINKRGIMLYIQTKSMESNWIIIDKDMLLCEVNGSLFAPEHFIEHKPLTRTGVVPLSKIESSFKDLITAKKIDPHMIIDFLVHMEFCREMREEDGLILITENHPKYKQERHFLFPALTQPEPPSDIWEPNLLIDYSEYRCCWLLQCQEYYHYLSSRFREVLLLRLAFTHAFPVRLEEVEPTSLTLHQNCSLWKYGIKWTTRSFVDVLVEVKDECAILLLRCKRGKELSLVKVRSQVIAEITSVKVEFCKNAATVEKFVPNPTYPVNMTSSVLLEDIAHAISCHEDGVYLSSHTPLDIAELLFFEPYKFCDPQCLVDVCSQRLQSCTVTAHFIDCISTNISCVDDFCTVLNVPLHKVVVNSSCHDHLKAVKMFQEWQLQNRGTYQCLKHQMDMYSVFSGRNILEIANIRPNLLPAPSPAISQHELDPLSSIAVQSGQLSIPPVSTVTVTEAPQNVDPQNFRKTVKRGDRVDMVALQRFSLQSQTINILQRVGSNYKPILGNMLLKSADGQRVRSSEMTYHGDVDQVVYDIFQKWCTENEDCTWENLVLHLRAANLNVLAHDIDIVLI